MIFGNPHKFAILMELIPDWTSTGSYKNGLFHFIVDGDFFPDVATVATLDGDIFCLSNGNALVNPIINSELFNMDKETLFFSMLRMMLPELIDPEFDVPDDFVTCYDYQASTYNLENHQCYTFAVSNGEFLRILSSKVSELKMYEDGERGHWENIVNPKINEIILTHEEVKK